MLRYTFVALALALPFNLSAFVCDMQWLMSRLFSILILFFSFFLVVVCSFFSSWLVRILMFVWLIYSNGFPSFTADHHFQLNLWSKTICSIVYKILFEFFFSSYITYTFFTSSLCLWVKSLSVSCSIHFIGSSENYRIMRTAHTFELF